MNSSAAYLIRTSDQKKFALGSRLITIGASPQSTIQIAVFPEHFAHILFTAGSYTLTVLHHEPPLFVNNAVVKNPVVLHDSDRISVTGTFFTFVNSAVTAPQTDGSRSPLRQFIHALSHFNRTADSDVRFEMLSGIAQLLGSDGARLVSENADGSFVTIARFPASSALDRFSERALVWAKRERVSVLMHDIDWNGTGDSKGSLEVNRIGSILCAPLAEGSVMKGYLYLDKTLDRTPFTTHEKEILDDVAPLFGDLLALHERSARQQETIVRLQQQIEKQSFPIICGCDAMQQSINRAATFAATGSTVLITGETGTGKELFARLIHEHSTRSAKPFHVVNCGAIPENLIESELFGHEKGAFTGAHQKQLGLFERAHEGSVFLDEIGEMPLKLQVKLLRVLQEGEILPVGATSPRKIDVRIIAATNRDLALEVKNGTFREDLYYRLAVLQIAIPPLRNRDRDVLLIADYMIKKYAQRFGIPEKALSLPAQALLLSYSWPGNIRQLENVMQKALLVATGMLITEDAIEIGECSPPRPGGGSTDTVASSAQTLREARAVAEKTCIIEALKKANGNVSVAARLVDTDRKWLTKLLKTYAINPQKYTR